MPKSNLRSLRPRLNHPANPFRLYRTGRLAELLDVDPSTIWKWEKNGTLPKPIRIAGVHGWTEEMLTEFFAARRQVSE